jgi:sugar lactone lactonase YvrE
MRRDIIRRAIWAVVLLASPGALLAVTGREEATTSKAIRVETDGFLKAPAGADASTFTVARTAPRVDVCFFAGLEDHGKGTLWSSWGDGCLAKSGKYYTSVGDHLGVDANSYLYEYDPVRGVLRRVVDVLEAIGQMLGLYGHGKIHSGIHEAADGKLYFSTYWGKHREVDAAFTKGYNGSLLLAFDPATGKTENLGAIVPKQGLPASHFDPRRQLLFFHAVYRGDITAYDLKARKVRFQGGGDTSAANRTFMGDARGRVWFSGTDGLHYYDPDKNALVATTVKLPATPGAKKGDTLRAAATRPAKDGTLYGMTAAGALFAFDPDKQTVRDLGPNFGKGDYTAVMALSPDEKYLYYAPGAHGSAGKYGTPVVQYEIATGKRKVLAFLQAPLQDKLKYQIGGTYNLQIDPAGERLFFTFNGAAPGARSAFGRPAVVVVHVPAEERK